MKYRLEKLILKSWLFFFADSVLDRDIAYTFKNEMVYYASDVKKWIVQSKN